MSPVADDYGKQGLVPVVDRVAMCQLAAAETAQVMVDDWEARQPGYTRTLQVGAVGEDLPWKLGVGWFDGTSDDVLQMVCWLGYQNANWLTDGLSTMELVRHRYQKTQQKTAS
jgi:hypothetical protein